MDKTWTERAELAGFAGPDGVVGTDALANDPVPVPSVVWLEDDLVPGSIEERVWRARPAALQDGPRGLVRWTFEPPSGIPPERRPEGMLGALLRVTNATEVSRFVRRYGPVGFCLHALPVAHNPAPMPLLFDRPDWWRKGTGHPGVDWAPGDPDPVGCMVPYSGLGHFEFVTSYVRLADQLRTGLSIAAKLRDASPLGPLRDLGSDDEWSTFTMGHFTGAPGFMPNPGTGEPGHTLATRVYVARFRFAQYVHTLTRMARFRPGLDWKKDAQVPRFVLQADAFGTLLYQFITAITGAHSIARCDGCGKAYRREGNKAPAGRKNWCPPCRITTVWMVSKRSSRARAGVPLEARQCSRCGTTFQPRRYDQKNCGAQCPALNH